jgi:hypothetical protein
MITPGFVQRPKSGEDRPLRKPHRRHRGVSSLGLSRSAHPPRRDLFLEGDSCRLSGHDLGPRPGRATR